MLAPRFKKKKKKQGSNQLKLYLRTHLFLHDGGSTTTAEDERWKLHCVGFICIAISV